MDNIAIFIKLLELEAEKSLAIAKVDKPGSAEWIKNQEIRGNVLKECVDYANLILVGTTQKQKL